MAEKTIDLGRVVGEMWFLAARGSGQEPLPSGTITKLTLNERMQYEGGSLRLSDDGGIEVLKDGTYRVTADLYMAGGPSRRGVYIYQGQGWSSAQELCGVYMESSIAGHVQCVGFTTATEGEVFYIAGRSYGSDSANAGKRWLLVERVK